MCDTLIARITGCVSSIRIYMVLLWYYYGIIMYGIVMALHTGIGMVVIGVAERRGAITVALL